ncbi:MAG: DUF3426 domain-containing protein [Desulfuromonadaceae bacterium]
MIIQCEKCQTKFRLDDSRVTDKGVKVRCTRCKHVFTVRKEVPGDDSLQPGAVLAGIAPPAATGETPVPPADEWSFAADTIPTPPAVSVTATATSDEWDFAGEAAPPPEADSIAFGNIPLESEPTAFTPLEPSPFDTSEISFDTDEDEMSGTGSGQTSSATTTTGGNEFDFSDDELSGSVVQTTPEATPGDFSFDFEDTGFDEAGSVNGQDSGSKSDTPPSFDTPAGVPFNPGEIDFGDELTPAVPQVSQKVLKPSQEVLIPLTEATVTSEDDTITQSFLGQAALQEQEEELPPLSIPSRRKQSPLFGALIAVVALLVISVLGYFGYSSLSTPKGTAPPESGKISVRAVTSTFVKNSSAGELLVVSGEAFNEYANPRAALQVMVAVFDTTGQKIATRNAYGGNPLTKEQQETLPLDKIEAAMANQFGDSLANMGVAPGKSIPFVVVLANIPSGAKDFSVQSAGSTVATGK